MQPLFASLDLEMPPLDFRRLQMVAETDQEKASLLGFFFDVAADIIQEMEMAAKCGGLTQWKDAAHKLRGAAGNIGMASLEKLCFDCEHIDAAQCTPTNILLQEIRTELAHIKAYIAEKNPYLLASGI